MTDAPAWWFRALLRLYPASFRDEWGDEMWRVHLARRERTRGLGVLALVAAAVADAAANGLRAQWDVLRQDLGYALRTLRRTPGFTATVMLVTALGIGANAAAFTVTDYVLLRPLPFADADRLMALWQQQTGQRGQWEASPVNFREWKKAPAFESMGGTFIISLNLVGRGEPQRLDGAALTADVLPMLGAAPALGRVFTAEDDRDGAPGTVLLSWGLWQTAFAGDENVLGTRISLDGESFTVIGVMPEGFAYPLRETQYWTPMRFAPTPSKTPATPTCASSASSSAERRRPRRRRSSTASRRRSSAPIPTRTRQIHATVTPLREDVSFRSRALVLTLSGAALCVLFIACLNIANLMLARALDAAARPGVRAALGASTLALARRPARREPPAVVRRRPLGVGAADWGAAVCDGAAAVAFRGGRDGHRCPRARRRGRWRPS